MKLRVISPVIEVPSIMHVVRASCISPPERNAIAMFAEMNLAQEWLRDHSVSWTHKHPGSLWIETVEVVE